MNEPKFVPGERVILESKLNPECNGEHTVASVCFYEEAFNINTSKLFRNIWLYKLDGVNACADGWSEHALRKLPPNTPSAFEECIFKPEKVKV